MSAKFVVKQFHNVGGISSVITGVVGSGEVCEGDVGMTARGKRFTVVKIEIEGQQVRKAGEGNKINISVKYLSRSDVRMGEIFNF